MHTAADEFFALDLCFEDDYYLSDKELWIDDDSFIQSYDDSTLNNL